MAIAYLIGQIASTPWGGATVWSSDANGLFICPPPQPGDTAYFASSGAVTSSVQIVSGEQGASIVDIFTALSTTISGTGTFFLGSMYARAGCGEVTVSTLGVNLNNSVTNESSNSITFINNVQPSSSVLFGTSGSGSILFQSGMDFQLVDPNFRYITVNSTGTGVVQFAALTNVTGGLSPAGLVIQSGGASVSSAGSTTCSIASGATLFLGTGTQTGLLSGSGTLAKDVAGTLVLPAPNTYSGGTTISQGSVKTGNATSLGTGPVSIASGATLQVGSTASGKLSLGGKLSLTGSTLRIGG